MQSKRPSPTNTCHALLPFCLRLNRRLPARSDLLWSFNGVNCTQFATSSGPGVENCQQFWATGVGADNVRVTASVACEVSCGNDGAVRECVVPPAPEPEPEPEPEPDLEPRLCAE